MALGEIVTTSAVITAVIAFSMQDTLGNLLAGVSIQLDNSIAIGDWLQVETTQGRVVEINWRATTIETRNWETVVIPNSHLLKQRFTVLGRRQNAPAVAPLGLVRHHPGYPADPDHRPGGTVPAGDPHPPRLRQPAAGLPADERGKRHRPLRGALLAHRSGGGRSHRLGGAHPDRCRPAPQRPAPDPAHLQRLHDHGSGSQDQRHKRHTAERTDTLRRLPLFAMLQEEELLRLADQVKFAPSSTAIGC